MCRSSQLVGAMRERERESGMNGERGKMLNTLKRGGEQRRGKSDCESSVLTFVK